jgi:hypothetical protein
MTIFTALLSPQATSVLGVPAVVGRQSAANTYRALIEWQPGVAVVPGVVLQGPVSNWYSVVKPGTAGTVGAVKGLAQVFVAVITGAGG